MRLAVLLADAGVDLVDVSTGGNAPGQTSRSAPATRSPSPGGSAPRPGMPTGAVGLITEPKQAEEIVADGSADVVLLARALLREPHWALRAAHELGVEVGDGIDWPNQYLRAVPS